MGLTRMEVNDVLEIALQSSQVFNVYSTKRDQQDRQGGEEQEAGVMSSWREKMHGECGNAHPLEESGWLNAAEVKPSLEQHELHFCFTEQQQSKETIPLTATYRSRFAASKSGVTLFGVVWAQAKGSGPQDRDGKPAPVRVMRRPVPAAQDGIRRGCCCLKTGRSCHSTDNRGART